MASHPARDLPRSPPVAKLLMKLTPELERVVMPSAEVLLQVGDVRVELAWRGWGCGPLGKLFHPAVAAHGARAQLHVGGDVPYAHPLCAQLLDAVVARPALVAPLVAAALVCREPPRGG